MDGNPIYSAFFENICKAVRIIQIRTDADEQSLSIWLDKTDWNEKGISELVVSVKPERHAMLQAQNFIKDFIEGRLLPSAIELSNLQFEKLFGIEKNERGIMTLVN